MAWFALIILLLIAAAYLVLRGDDLSHLDSHVIPRPAGEPSDGHHVVVASLKEMTDASGSLMGRNRVAAIREYMDGMTDGKEFDSEFRPVSMGSVRGEWVLAPGANPARRLLYIHGGAFMAGSPKSHRTITDRLSHLADAAVFSLDYRLMPENKRIDGVNDCRNAYRWILANGPDGPQALEFLAVAGDSAGGNLTLMIAAWARDEGLRSPDAAIAFSPATDGTLTAPSWRANISSDPMLGPAFGKLGRVPHALLWWASLFSSRMLPSNPVVSPLHGDLSGLPPILVQASEAEMLFDDSRRYVTKAQLAGSPVELQSFPHMVHVWQLFTPELAEAEHAYENIAEFLASAEGSLEAVKAA